MVYNWFNNLEHTLISDSNKALPICASLSSLFLLIDLMCTRTYTHNRAGRSIQVVLFTYFRNYNMNQGTCTHAYWQVSTSIHTDTHGYAVMASICTCLMLSWQYTVKWHTRTWSSIAKMKDLHLSFKWPLELRVH